MVDKTLDYSGYEVKRQFFGNMVGKFMSTSDGRMNLYGGRRDFFRIVELKMKVAMCQPMWWGMGVCKADEMDLLSEGRRVVK